MRKPFPHRNFPYGFLSVNSVNGSSGIRRLNPPIELKQKKMSQMLVFSTSHLLLQIIYTISAQNLLEEYSLKQ